MDTIKIRYTWKRKSDGQIQQFTDYLHNLEGGELFKNPYFLHPEYDLTARDLYIGKNDASGNEIFNNDILDWGDNFPSKVYYDSDECAFRIEELGIKEGELAPRTHDMESQTNQPKILGNIHINPQSVKP